MIRTVEAVIDEQGNVRLLEPVHLPSVRRALVTILEDRQVAGPSESALLSEAALAEDWVPVPRPVADEVAPGSGSCGRPSHHIHRSRNAGRI